MSNKFTMTPTRGVLVPGEKKTITFNLEIKQQTCKLKNDWKPPQTT